MPKQEIPTQKLELEETNKEMKKAFSHLNSVLSKQQTKDRR